jgi:ribosomal protein L37AE/L43A
MKPTSPERGVCASTVGFHELLVRHGPAYLKRFGPAMPARQREVLERTLRCRTPALGGQLFACPDCGAHHYRYHSCNDRHCPRCGRTDADQWLARQELRLLLPTNYFLVTFTLPEPLRAWMRSHPKAGYDLLFQTSAQALQDLAANPKHLGASLAMLGILHTWSRTLIYHPHIHYLVPGGGLSPDHRQWVPAQEKFLLPVYPLSDHFRHLFYQALQKDHPQALHSLPGKIWKQRWVVHSQVVGAGREALQYLSRYVFKTATGNRPLAVLPDGRVRWPYRDSATGRSAHQDLTPEELLRRFLQHVQPSGYHRVRLFGWFHPASRKKLNRVRALLKQSPLLTQAEREAWQPGQEKVQPVQPMEEKPARTPECPHCHKPMVLVGIWRAGQSPLVLARAPP